MPFARMLVLVAATGAALASAPGVALAGPGVPGPASKPAAGALGRDWTAHPAIVDVTPPSRHVFALSDMHGHYGHTVDLLHGNGLIAGKPASLGQVQWTGGKATLVVVGDLIDKDRKSVETLDLVRALQKSAAASGGHVVVVMGNHEAEFLANPENGKASRTGRWEGMSTELRAMRVNPADVARGTDAGGRGAWLRSLPLGARVGDYFFAHSGDTGGKTIPQLERGIQRSLDTHGFAGKAAVGASSILEADEWYGRSAHDATARDNAKKLGVEHIVFGHDPSGLAHVPNTVEAKRIVATKDRTLVKIDTGMAYGHKGRLLHLDLEADTATSLGRKGGAKPIY